MSSMIKYILIGLGVVLLLFCFLFWIIPNNQNETVFEHYEVAVGATLDILKILGLVSFILGIYSFNINRKKLNFSVLQSCVTRFHDFIDVIDSEKPAPKDLRKYVDFVNEELFYIQNDYLPQEVCEEWIDGMIDTMPIYNSKGEWLNPTKSGEADACTTTIHEENLLQNFSRVKNAFTVKSLNVENIYSLNSILEKKARKNLIKIILKNLKKS